MAKAIALTHHATFSGGAGGNLVKIKLADKSAVYDFLRHTWVFLSLVLWVISQGGCRDSDTARSSDQGAVDVRDQISDIEDIERPSDVPSQLDVPLDGSEILPNDVEEDARPVPECLIGAAGGVCTTDHCTVIVQPETFTEDTELRLTTRTAAATLEVELVRPEVCEWDLAEANPMRPIELVADISGIALPQRFAANDIQAIRVEGNRVEALPTLVDTVNQRVRIVSMQSETWAMTLVPSEIVFERNLQANETSLDTPAAFLSNLSDRVFRAAFIDPNGRVYIGNGDRLLIYDTLPTDPLQPPDIILGKPDLASTFIQTSAASFTDNVSGIWSDGQRLVVSDKHRILIWNQHP